MSTYPYSRDIIAPGKRLYSDRVTGQSVLTGQSSVVDVETSGSSRLTVQGDLTGAAIGDLAITVQPYLEDNITLSNVVLTPVQAPANVLGGGHVSSYAEYDITGLGRCRILAKNNNAGTQTLGLSWRCSGI